MLFLQSTQAVASTGSDTEYVAASLAFCACNNYTTHSIRKTTLASSEEVEEQPEGDILATQGIIDL